MVITNAATGNPNVKGLVYADAFEPAAGESVEQLTFAQPGSCLAGGGNLNNVVNFAVDPSQPAGDYDLYLKIPPGRTTPASTRASRPTSRRMRRTCSEQRNGRSHSASSRLPLDLRHGRASRLGL